jgi:hypothetical protein
MKASRLMEMTRHDTNAVSVIFYLDYDLGRMRIMGELRLDGNNN